MKKKKSEDVEKLSRLPGYPGYPESEDIFEKSEEEGLIVPDEMTKKTAKKRNEKDLKDVSPGEDLDVPGSELDDEEESIGSEDEENNYYSLGGDDHADLEEDKS